MEPGSTRRVAFIVKNTSDKPMEIKEVRPECKCTRILESPHEIAAGGIAGVAVEFVAPRESGDYAKRIFLLGSPGTAPLATLEIRAAIGLPLVVQPKELMLPREASDTLQLTISYRGTTPVRLLYSTSDAQGCVALVPRENIAPRSSAIISVRWKGLAEGKHGNGQLTIHTSAVEQPSLLVKLGTEKDMKFKP